MPREGHPWTLDKLKVVENYLPAYLTATMGAKERVYGPHRANVGVGVKPTQN